MQILLETTRRFVLIKKMDYLHFADKIIKKRNFIFLPDQFHCIAFKDEKQVQI
jgi:hypothetical protein